MSELAMAGNDPGRDNNEGDASIFDALDAEAAEEQHLDDRHATGEHFTGGHDDDTEQLGSL